MVIALDNASSGLILLPNKQGTLMREAQIDRREAAAELRVGIRIALPPGGLGGQRAIMQAWLDATCGPAGWAATPAATDGVRNDALLLHFADAAHARAFVVRFCCGYLAPRQPGSPSS
jgi:hypothetical protein